MRHLEPPQRITLTILSIILGIITWLLYIMYHEAQHAQICKDLNGNPTTTYSKTHLTATTNCNNLPTQHINQAKTLNAKLETQIHPIVTGKQIGRAHV